MVNYRDELEIDIREICLFILTKWKLIICGFVLGGILGSGFTVISHNEQSLVQNTEQEKTTIDDLKMKLSPKEIRDVDLAYNAYLTCEELYRDIERDDNINIEQDAELVRATEALLAINSSFTADQKLYYAALFEDEDNSVETDSADLSQAIEPATIGGGQLVRYVILGAVGGACVVILIICMAYILKPVLKTEDDLRIAFKLPIIGRIKSGDNSSIGYISSSILACIRRTSLGKVYLDGASNDTGTQSLKDKICDLLADKDVEVIAQSNIITDSIVIDSIADSDGVILFEKIGESRYEDIAREIELCKSFGIAIIGAVVIQ